MHCREASRRENERPPETLGRIQVQNRPDAVQPADWPRSSPAPARRRLRLDGDDPAPPQHPDPRRRAGRADGRRALRMYTLRPDRLPLRPRRQPPHVPARRPHPAGPAVPRRRPSDVQNITDVGHLRDERFDRGEDRMLVEAGLENRSPAEIADAYEAAFHADAALVNLLPAHVFPRATEHIPEMLALAERLEDPGPRLRQRRRERVLRRRVVPGLRRPVRQHARGPAGRPPGRGRGRQARPGRLRAVEGRRRGRMLKWPTPRWGDGFPGWHLECSAMARRYLGRPVRHPHRRHRQRLPASRGRDRPVGAARRRAAGHDLGPRRVPAVAGRKMAKSAGNFQRVTELAASGIDPLAFRYLVPDLALPPQARLHRRIRSAAAAAGLASLRAGLAAARSAARDGALGGAGSPRAGTAPPRPTGTATGIAGNGDGTGPPLEDRAHAPAAALSDAGRAFHDRFVAAIDDDLDLPDRARGRPRDPPRRPAGRRATLADPGCGLRPGARSPAQPGPRFATSPLTRPSSGCSSVAPRPGPRATLRRAIELRDELAALDVTVIDGPDGQVARRG